MCSLACSPCLRLTGTGAACAGSIPSDLDGFPLTEADEVEDSPWFRTLFVELRPIIANDPETILEWLPDWQSLIDMGYGSLVNLPLVIGGNAVGLLNVMASEGHFSANRLEALKAEGPLATLAVMAAQGPPPTVALDRIAPPAQ